MQVDDPRTAKATSSLYRDGCKATGSTFYGVGATLDDSGKVANPGRVNGTLVVEIKGWDSANLMTMVFAIITQELVGDVEPFVARTTLCARDSQT